MEILRVENLCKIYGKGENEVRVARLEGTHAENSEIR